MRLRSTLVAQSLFANICALGACLLLAPATAKAQSLLESWAFVHHRALIPIDELKESADGTLVTPDHPGVAKEDAEVWTVIDKPGCIIRAENTSSGAVTEFYLNNMSSTRATVLKADGSFLIGVMGDKPVQCRHLQSEKLCDHFTTLTSSDSRGYRAIERTLNHIYGTFCRRETPSPTAPGMRTGFLVGDRLTTSAIR
jgi:hypothetical protein